MSNNSSNLDALFHPKSVAVIGASKRRGSLGREILHNIMEYEFNGKLFPVNPRAEFIHSMKCYASILDIPDEVELAVIVVPAARVLRVVDECGRKGVRGLVVISAGFKETGQEGAAREAELLDKVRSYGMRLIGPNCMGIFSTHPEVRLNATFAPTQPFSGDVALMSQSGAMGVAILHAITRMNIGFTFFASVGNKADVSGNDLLSYWENDDRTKVIAMYLESFGNPRRFTRLAKQISKKKPLIIVKSGRSPEGARAATSHTGALAGGEVAVDALFQQCGVLRAESIEDMLDLLMGFSRCPIPRGNRVAVLTNAGGPAIMATDVLLAMGMQMAELDDRTRRSLASFLPAEASFMNPVDMIASAEANDYRRALEILLADSNVDAVIAISVPPHMLVPDDVALAITAAAHGHSKPVLASFMAKEEFYEHFPRQHPNSPPLYRFPESAARSLAALYEYHKWQQRPVGELPRFTVDRDRAETIFARQAAEGGGELSQEDAFEVLQAYGIRVAPAFRVRNEADVRRSSAGIAFPQVLKVADRRLTHKSDVGGVVLNLESVDAVVAAMQSMRRRIAAERNIDEVEGFLLQQQVPAGREVILGVAQDPIFGPLLMFGSGGRNVEVFKDIAFRVLPITDIDASEMIQSIKGYPLLTGFRGDPPVHLESAHEVLLRMAQLVWDFDCIEEMDINPFVLSGRAEDCVAVDVRIRTPAAPARGAVSI